MTPRERIEALERAYRQPESWGGVWATGADIEWLLAVARAAVAWRAYMLPAREGSKAADLIAAVDGDESGAKGEQ